MQNTQDIFWQVFDKGWEDKETGFIVNSEDIYIIIDNILDKLEKELNILNSLFKCKEEQILIICDKNTYEILAKNIKNNLKQAEILILEPNVKTSINICQKIINNNKNSKAIIGVGSGTINDIAKYVSYNLDIPYAIFATAASMNGFISKNASIIDGKFRTSKQAHSPIAAFFDINIIANAPIRLTKSGITDVLCYYSCKYDWQISHNLIGTFYNESFFNMLKPYEEILLKAGIKILQQDLDAISALIKLLLLSGLSMTIAGSSAPASGSEHMIAHTLEMLDFETMKNLHHGEVIGITTYTALLLQEESYSKFKNFNEEQKKQIILENLNLDKDFINNIKTKYNLDDNLLSQMLNEFENKKQKIIKNLDNANLNLAKPFAASKYKEYLNKINAPIAAKDLGINQDLYNDAVLFSRYTRDRVTNLDLKYQPESES